MRGSAITISLTAIVVMGSLVTSCGGGGGHSGGFPNPPGTPPPPPPPPPGSPPPPPPPPPPPGVTVFADVLGWHNDIQHTGQNLSETTLTPSTVMPAHFGKLFTQPVDGQVYAQPVYKSQLRVAGVVHNVVYVVTMHDSVYAFDADTLQPALWHVSFLGAGVTSVPLSDYPGYTDILNEIGILSTPAIDPASSTLYVVAKTKETAAVTGANPNGHVYRLHALDLATGAEKLGGPVVLGGTFAGTGDASVGGVITFDPEIGDQRCALLLLNGAVYIAFASYGDQGAYHGWVMAYSASTLAQIGIWNDSPNNPTGGATPGLGGIWMSGASPASDGTSLFLSTGNGYFDTSGTVTDYGDSVVRLNAGALTVGDYFTPSNQSSLNSGDLDLDACGLLLLPDQPGSLPHLLVTAGKDGTVYLLNRDNLTKFNATDQAVQEQMAFPGITSTPAYWNGTLYFKPGSVDISGSATKSPLYAFALVPGAGATPTQINFTATSQSTATWGWPGATPTISANGNTGGIVWVTELDFQLVGGKPAATAAILHAFNATNLATELYNSTQNPGDGMGNGVKFTLPIVANGKVFVGADALAPSAGVVGELNVFGPK